MKWAKVCLVKAMVFPVVMYGCESWTVKKAERRKTYAFELWCWRRLLRVPWTARGYNQSILNENIPGCPLEGLMLKLKLQYIGHFMRRVDSLEKTLMLGGVGGRRRRGRWRMRWLDGITNLMDTSLSKLWALLMDRRPGMLQPMGSQRVDMTEWLNWTELMGPDAMILVFWMLQFKPTFSLSSFTFIKRLFSSSSLSAIRVVSSAEVIDISPSNLDSRLCFIQPSVSRDVLCMEVK